MAMMTEEHKRLLKVNHFNILERIVDVDAVLDHLFQMEIISKDTLEKINLKQTIKDKARALMLQLARLSEEAYHAFLLALLRTNQIELARLFDPNYEGPDTVDKDASEISLIETFKFEDLQTEMMSDAEVYMHIKDKRNYKLPFLERNSDMIYGRVLIINNIEFDILDRRTGLFVE
ncbi:hypothetical protein HELRODRAFT_174553 [Helobdella robusta]|uniref:CARD domain-containing protein n=1 Tax=Helobdella robusta TaxID=6412 RepID=T1F890_HELRO|nr:hypothetical protein HELRODRAFT_174553 [Helobdella robusta]ESO01595.1 hypothetical protein HELRODRAFT_174553 [Helobdella robusta]